MLQPKNNQGYTYIRKTKRARKVYQPNFSTNFCLVLNGQIPMKYHSASVALLGGEVDWVKFATSKLYLVDESPQL